MRIEGRGGGGGRFAFALALVLDLAAALALGFFSFLGGGGAPMRIVEACALSSGVWPVAPGAVGGHHPSSRWNTMASASSAEIAAGLHADRIAGTLPERPMA